MVVVLGLNKEEDGGGRETMVLAGEIRTRGRVIRFDRSIDREREREIY